MSKKVPTKNNLEQEVLRVLNSHRAEFKYKLEYEPDEIPYVLKKVYIPDFKLTFKDGRVIYVEAKGYLRPEDKSKILSAREQNPELDIRIIFQRDNRFPRSKTRYSDWAKKHDLIFAVGEIPTSWLT